MNSRFEQAANKPDLIVVDRGRGFWATNTGKITAEFKGALRGHGRRTFMRDDAGKQPGSLQEVLLHETAVAWIRCRLACTSLRSVGKRRGRSIAPV